MIGLGAVVLPLYLYALWVTRKKGVGTVPESKLLKNVAVWSILAPFFGIALGWIFTEMGRQPFVVAPTFRVIPRFTCSPQQLSPRVFPVKKSSSPCSPWACSTVC